MSESNQSLDIQTLLDGYREKRFTPQEVIDSVLARIEACDDPAVWISRLSREQLAFYIDALKDKSPDDLPLYGIPFAIKDNIDLAGLPTTAACAEYAYEPEQHAFVVQRLIDAGAIPLGKTNLDQFATGLVGTRSPYGACRNSFNPEYISGGSSSGSSVAVARGLVSFSLGTDTAGSGRVPAAFNNLVGIKPTKGLLSTGGVVPACRSLDCVSIFALNCVDGQRVLNVAAAFDAEDPYSRPAVNAPRDWNPRAFRFGVPRAAQLQFFGNAEAQALFAASCARLEALGGQALEIDFAPFLEAARLLYEGPWVTERYVAIEDFITQQPQAMFPVTHEIIAAGAKPLASDAFKAQYRLLELKRRSEPVWDAVDFIVTPSAGTIYRTEEVNADPIQLNSNLGYYTNFMNLLDLSALAVPAGFQPDGLPFGVTLVAPAFEDHRLLVMGQRLHEDQHLSMGATGIALPSGTGLMSELDGERMEVAVCGAHLSGLPLNHQLTERGAQHVATTHTAACYRLYALPGGPPWRPGLVRDESGAAIEVEVWSMPMQHVGSFLAGIPAPLGIGSVELADGRYIKGFICEPWGVNGARDITALGGWRAYIADNT